MGSTRATAKQRVRSLVDRIILPYVDTVVDRVGVVGHTGGEPVDATPAQVGTPTSTSDYSHVSLHELRTIQLERVPKGAARALSVGANGSWYFHWFEKAVGVVEEHLGVEAFEPKPTDLPEYVTWIPDTADHMVGVRDASVDLVFAGQTSEHLWSYELSGFLEEAHRVLRPDGHLVLDSPNRVVTEHLNWSHGGHTVELTIDEMEALLDLAGFDVTRRAGIWSCVIDGNRLQLEEGLHAAATFTRRASSAYDAPDESFVWWLNARRREAPPDSARLRARTRELYEPHWNTCVCRGLFPVPGADRLLIDQRSASVVGTTLPFPLKQGSFSLKMILLAGSWDDLVVPRVSSSVYPEAVAARADSTHNRWHAPTNLSAAPLALIFHESEVC